MEDKISEQNFELENLINKLQKFANQAQKVNHEEVLQLIKTHEENIDSIIPMAESLKNDIYNQEKIDQVIEKIEKLKETEIPIHTKTQAMTKFTEAHGSLKTAVTNLTNDIKSTNDSFIEKLARLSEKQKSNQYSLHNKLDNNIKLFNEIYDNVVHEGKFVALNNIYEMDMMNFSVEHAIFQKEEKKSGFIVKLSYE